MFSPCSPELWDYNIGSLTYAYQLQNHIFRFCFFPILIDLMS